MAMVDILREDQVEMVVVTVVILLEAQTETMVVIHPVQVVMVTVMEQVMDKMKIM